MVWNLCKSKELSFFRRSSKEVYSKRRIIGIYVFYLLHKSSNKALSKISRLNDLKLSWVVFAHLKQSRVLLTK